MDYVPPPGQFAGSNLGRLAARHGIGTLDALLRRARDDPAWFWQEAERDLGIVWQRPYGAVLDAARGPERAEWFTGGLTNIYCSSVGRHAAEHPGRTAYWFHPEDGPAGSMTYGELDAEASVMAAGLAGAGVGAGEATGGHRSRGGPTHGPPAGPGQGGAGRAPPLLWARQGGGARSARGRSAVGRRALACVVVVVRAGGVPCPAGGGDAARGVPGDRAGIRRRGPRPPA